MKLHGQKERLSVTKETSEAVLMGIWRRIKGNYARTLKAKEGPEHLSTLDTAVGVRW